MLVLETREDSTALLDQEDKATNDAREVPAQVRLLRSRAQGGRRLRRLHQAGSREPAGRGGQSGGGRGRATLQFSAKPPVNSDHEGKAMKKDTAGDDEKGELVPLDSLDADNLGF